MTVNVHHSNRGTRVCVRGLSMGRLLKAAMIVGVSVTLMMPSASLAAEQVWLMAGQSNMIGWGTVAADLPVELQQPQSNVKVFTGSGWNDLAPGFGNVFGPEIGFGRDMAAAQPGVDVLLVKAPFGLGNLYNNWRSPNTGRGSAGEHYTNFMTLVSAALVSKPDAQIAGMIWMQGEGDGYDTLTMATSYADNLRLFIESVRDDLQSPNMPFILGQISSSNAWVHGGLVQQAQAEVAETVANCYMVPTSDLPLSDNMHYTSLGQVQLGSRFAGQALQAIGVPEPSEFALLATVLAGLAIGFVAKIWHGSKGIRNLSHNLMHHGSRLMRAFCLTALIVAGICCRVSAAESTFPITDKTLVVWVAPADLTQKAGSVLTLENPGNVFDAVVLGEVAPGKWMAGSNDLARTEKDQTAAIAETVGADKYVQIAVVYRGKQVTIYRDGQPYAGYAFNGEPIAFTKDCIALLGLRHRSAGVPRIFAGAIDDARIYNTALDAAAIATLKPNQASEPKPIAWWSFEDGTADDLMKTFPSGHLVGKATITDGKLNLPGEESYMLVGGELPRTRATEDWPSWHFTALPQEAHCLPYDPNGAIFWKGRYHLMYIYQERGLHCWGHATSTDLVDWTFHPATLKPAPGDPDKGIFSGNALVGKDGKPMLCWFGCDAGVCVATAEDDDLIRWKKHPKNPIIPMSDKFKVWDPYLWLEGDTYYCLLGGNRLPNGKDTLYLMKSPDLVDWTPLHPFYEHPDLSWTKSSDNADVLKSEDCSCPDFFKLGDKHVLLCISHMLGGRCYVGRYENEKFYPEQHVRMNWSGGTFFAPESLLDDKGRRIFWAWVMDPRLGSTKNVTGSGAMSLPRIMSMAADNTLQITPAPELQTLRRNHREVAGVPIAADAEVTLPNVRGDSLELCLEIDPGQAGEVGLKVRCSPDGKEETAIVYNVAAKTLTIDMAKSTLRTDVAYGATVLDMAFRNDPRTGEHPKSTVEAPFELHPGETLKLRLFLDKPMLEVFANDRQCVTQQIFPASREALGIKVFARGGTATVRSGETWDMAPAKFVDKKGT